MRKATRCLIPLCLCLLTLCLPAAADIVTPVEGAAAAGDSLALPPMNPSRVLRQRAVRIDVQAVSSALEAGLPVHLELFADSPLEVSCDRLSLGPDHGLTCLGSWSGALSGTVTLAVGDTSMAATFVGIERRFKIRPLDDQWHLVRELRPQPGSVVWAAAATSDERAVWTLTNEERADSGLHALSLNGDLVASARAHSADMATQDYFDHEGLDGRSPGQRMAAAGYAIGYWGENIAANSPIKNPQTTMDQWMNSPGHRANILSSDFCDLGVGYAAGNGSRYDHYWTQNFGRQAGVSECPAVVDGGDGGGDDSGGDSGGGGSDSGSGSSGSGGGGCFLGTLSPAPRP